MWRRETGPQTKTSFAGPAPFKVALCANPTPSRPAMEEDAAPPPAEEGGTGRGSGAGGGGSGGDEEFG